MRQACVTHAFTGAVVLSLCTTAFSQGDFADVTIKTTPVSGKVYMLEGAGGNIGISAGADGVLMVDDQFAPLSEKIRTAMKALSPGRLRFVLNTHHHGDHIGGNALFGREATIIAHDNVRTRLATDQTTPGRERKAEPPEAWPVITFDRSLSVHFNGEEIEVLHLPAGHTDGDAVIFFTGSNVVHMGDHFFAGRFPFVDLASGGDVVGYTRNVKEILAKLPAGAKIIPGHGPLSERADLEAFATMLDDSIALVRSAQAAGKTKDQVRAAGVPEKYAGWAWDFISADRWLDTVFDSLAAAAGAGKAEPPVAKP